MQIKSTPKSYRFGIDAPTRNAPVRFRVYIPDCLPGGEPIADYRGWGRFIGECADGFMVRVDGCTKQSNIGQVVYVRHCSDEYEAAEASATSPLQLTTPELTAESDGLAMRVLRRETTARDVSLVHELAARLRTMVMRPATNREALEGMLLVDIPDESEARAPVLRFDGVERRAS